MSVPPRRWRHAGPRRRRIMSGGLSSAGLAITFFYASLTPSLLSRALCGSAAAQ